jgi:hypothetical protein
LNQSADSLREIVNDSAERIRMRTTAAERREYRQRAASERARRETSALLFRLGFPRCACGCGKVADTIVLSRRPAANGTCVRAPGAQGAGMTGSPTAPRRPRRTMSIRTLLKRANSTASSRHGIGGKLKERHRPRAITLARIMCLERPAPTANDARLASQSAAATPKGAKTVRTRARDTALVWEPRRPSTRAYSTVDPK